MTPVKYTTNEVCKVFSLAAALLLIPANIYPVISISKMTRYELATFPESIIRVFESTITMGCIVTFCIVIAPGIILFSILYFSFTRHYPDETVPPEDTAEIWLIKMHKKMRSWSMIDVYFLATIGSIVKLSEIVNTDLGLGTFFYILVWLCLSIADKNFKIEYDTPIIKHSRQKTFIYSTAAFLFLIPANIFVLMVLVKTGKPHAASLWVSIRELLHGPAWPVGVIAFWASLCSPWIKVVSLWYLSLTTHLDTNVDFKRKLHKFLEVTGRWAMIDVFVGASLVSIVRLEALASVSLEIGSIYFSIMVVFTILGSSAFDPRLLKKVPVKA